jgi:hypothetical protein
LPIQALKSHKLSKAGNKTTHQFLIIREHSEINIQIFNSPHPQSSSGLQVSFKAMKTWSKTARMFCLHARNANWI